MADTRAILHVDMDAFFAAIAVRDDPALRGRPVLVGGPGPRAVVTAASYEARRFGCCSAMPMAEARRRCPQAVRLQVPGERIREVSGAFFALLEAAAPCVEPLSVDEAFLDVTGMERLAGGPVSLARSLKARIAATLEMTASVGVAHNKFLAKLGSAMEKPDGLTVIDPGHVHAMLGPLPVERLWGVGPKTLAKMHRKGLRTVGDLRAVGRESLVRWFGEAGGVYHRLAHGLDDRPVVPDRQSRSIGQEQTFDQDVGDPDHVRRVLHGQVEQVARRLRRHHRSARRVSVKIRDGDFRTRSRSRTLPEATDLTRDLWEAARALYDAWAAGHFVPVRLIGMAAERLGPPEAEPGLFPDPERDRERALDRVMDSIADRFGDKRIHRGDRG